MYTDRQGKVRKAIYFNNEDWEKIEKKAALCKLNTTRYIRKSALENYLVFYDLKEIRKLVGEVNKVGQNVNQIVRKVHESNNIYKTDVESLRKDYDELCSLICEFFSNLSSNTVL